MEQRSLKELFDYQNGTLYWKVCLSQRAGVGTQVGVNVPDGLPLTVRIHKKSYLVHRIIWMYHYGDIPEGLLIDHINGDRRDNRIENLRLVNHSENAQNRHKVNFGESGFPNVVKHQGKWRARIRLNYKHICGGIWDSPKEAFEAAMRLKSQHHPFRNQSLIV